MTFYDRMISGRLYDPTDKKLAALRLAVRKLVKQYNDSQVDDFKGREQMLRELFKSVGVNACMEPTIRFDYGCNTSVGDNFYANFNCVILDVAPVTIGNNVMFGPNVTIATPMHPIVASQRIIRKRADGECYDYEYAKPVTIGDNVWLASNVTVTGGVTIGEGSIIGAGSVVTRDVPPNSIAVGVPCKVIREITDKDLMDESDLLNLN